MAASIGEQSLALELYWLLYPVRHKDSPEWRALRAHLKHRVDVATRRQITHNDLMLELIGQKRPEAKTYRK